MDKVSVVIPSYNSSSYVMKAIDSVLNQTYDNLEIILVDDASTDDTCSIVKRTNDPRLKVIVRENNGGAAAARNTGINAASGRYIAFLDADDYWSVNKLSVQISEMRKHDASFSCTNYIVVAKKRKLLLKMPEEINYRQLLKGNIIHTSTVVYDSDKLGKIYMPELQMAEDFATWLNLLKRGGTALIVRQSLAYRLRRSDSLSSRILTMKYFTYRVYRETQGLPATTSLYYLLSVLPVALWKRLRGNYI